MLKERIILFILSFGFSVFSSFVFSQSFLQKQIVGEVIDKVTNIPESSFLVESHRISSPHAVHYTYDQYVKGTRILYSGLKIHVRADESVSVTNYLVDDDSYIPTNFLIKLFLLKVILLK